MSYYHSLQALNRNSYRDRIFLRSELRQLLTDFFAQGMTLTWKDISLFRKVRLLHRSGKRPLMNF
jgi:hypothetical protein